MKSKRQISYEKGRNHAQFVANLLTEGFACVKMPFHAELRNEHNKLLNVSELTRLNKEPRNKTDQTPNQRGVGYDIIVRGGDDVRGGLPLFCRPSNDKEYIKGPTPKNGYKDEEERIRVFSNYLKRLLDNDLYIIYFEKIKENGKWQLTGKISSKVYSLCEILGKMKFGKDWKVRYNKSNLNRIVLLNTPKDITYIDIINRGRQGFFDSMPPRILKQIVEEYKKRFK